MASLDSRQTIAEADERFHDREEGGRSGEIDEVVHEHYPRQNHPVRPNRSVVWLLREGRLVAATRPLSKKRGEAARSCLASIRNDALLDGRQSSVVVREAIHEAGKKIHEAATSPRAARCS